MSVDRSQASSFDVTVMVRSPPEALVVVLSVHAASAGRREGGHEGAGKAGVRHVGGVLVRGRQGRVGQEGEPAGTLATGVGRLLRRMTRKKTVM